MRKVVYDKREAVTIAATGTSFTFRLDSGRRNRGRLAEIVLEIPNYTNTVTTTLTVVRSANQGGDAVFTSDALTQNGTHTIRIADSGYGTVMVSESDVFTFTLSSAAGGSGGTLYCTPIVMED